MIVSGHQPQYLPYLGYFHKIFKCDIFMLVDHVQYKKKEWQNRNRIRTPTGWMLLSVPVLTRGKFYQSIKQVRINNNTRWKDKHWKAIRINYVKAPYFKKYIGFFDDLYSREWEHLSVLNETIINFIIAELGIKVKILKSSDYNFKGEKTSLLIEICRKTNCDTYLSGSGGKDYVNEEEFKIYNLRHMYDEYDCPHYHQQHMKNEKDFVPNLSIIDLLFNHGGSSLSILMGE